MSLFLFWPYRKSTLYQIMIHPSIVSLDIYLKNKRKILFSERVSNFIFIYSKASIFAPLLFLNFQNSHLFNNNLYFFYLSMKGEMRQGQVRSHRLLRIGWVVGTLLLLQRHRVLADIFFVVIVLLPMLLRILVIDCRRRACQQTIVKMRVIGDQQRTAVHSDTRLVCTLSL